MGNIGESLAGDSVILSGTQEAELEGHDTSLQQGWANGQSERGGRHSQRDPGGPQAEAQSTAMRTEPECTTPGTDRWTGSYRYTGHTGRHTGQEGQRLTA